MVRLVVLLCALIAFTAHADDSTNSSQVNEDEKHVHVLTKENFDSFIKEHSVCLVEFYAPWCGHCKKLAPEYAKAAKILNDKGGVPLAKVDATIDPELSQRYEVKGYPTIKLFRNEVAEEYEGGRTAESIVSWLEDMTGAPYVLASSIEEAKKLADSTRTTFIGQFSSKDSSNFKMFEELADSNRAYGKYFAVITPGSSDEVHVSRQDEDIVSHTVKDRDALLLFLKNEHLPLFGSINGENFSAYFSLNKEMVWFIGLEDTIKEVAPVMRQVAKQFRDGHNFVSLDADKYGSHAENALGTSEFPSLVLQSKKGRYNFPSKDFSSVKKIIDFFEDVRLGKIPKSLKSEPIPETQDGAVKVVVGNNFEDVVLDMKKDVLLEVYAPWCGHCKKLEPIYNELAESVAPFEHIVIAKMDGTTNESPVEDFDWTGFPTIFFVKAGEKKPLRFDGARTLEGFTSYLKNHSSKPLVGLDVKPKDTSTEAKDEL